MEEGKNRRLTARRRANEVTRAPRTPPGPFSLFLFPSSFSPGQALVEFVVALVCILALFAGLVQIGLLTAARTRTMIDARQEAGQNALMSQLIGSAPAYIEDWQPGPDTRTYSADDSHSTANATDFSSHLVIYGHPDDLQAWVPANSISPLYQDPSPVSMFGLVSGSASEIVELLPAVTHLLYAADEIKIHSEVWLGWSQGIY